MARQNEYQVIVSNRASQMLVSHVAFLAQVNKDAAEKVVLSFEHSINSLKVMPYRCPRFRGQYIPQSIYRYLIFEKRYLIILQIKDDIVYADYILDCGQDYRWLL